MKWINGLDRHDRREKQIERRSQWHPWFAWYPVTVGKTIFEKRQIKMWLTIVERRGEHYSGYAGCGWNWEYRERELE